MILSQVSVTWTWSSVLTITTGWLGSLTRVPPNKKLVVLLRRCACICLKLRQWRGNRVVVDLQPEAP
ncbi:hypothetical protein VTK26DRAFT_2860 [Humicola hyalothermophila]